MAWAHSFRGSQSIIVWLYCFGPVVRQHAMAGTCGGTKLLTSWLRSKGVEKDQLFPLDCIPTDLKTSHKALPITQPADQAFSNGPLVAIQHPNYSRTLCFPSRSFDKSCTCPSPHPTHTHEPPTEATGAVGLRL